MRWPLQCSTIICLFGICIPACDGAYWGTLTIFCNGSFIEESEDNLEVRPFYPGKFQNLVTYKTIPTEQDYYIGRAQQLFTSEDTVAAAAVVPPSPQAGDVWQRSKYMGTDFYGGGGVSVGRGSSAVREHPDADAKNAYQFYQELLFARGSHSARAGEGAQKSHPYDASSTVYGIPHDIPPSTVIAQSTDAKQARVASIQLSKEALVLLGKMSNTRLPLENPGKVSSRISFPSPAEKSTTAASSANPPRQGRTSAPEVQKVDARVGTFDTTEATGDGAADGNEGNISERDSEVKQFGGNYGRDPRVKDSEALRFFISVKPRGEESGTETSFVVTRGEKKQKKQMRRREKDEGEAEDGSRQRQETGNLETSVLKGQENTIRGGKQKHGKEAVKDVPKGYAEVNICSNMGEDGEFEGTALEGSSFCKKGKKKPFSSAAGQTEEAHVIDSSAYHLMQTQNFLYKHGYTGTEEERSFLARLALERLAEAAAEHAAATAETAAASAPAAAARAAVRGDVAPPTSPPAGASAGAVSPEATRESSALLEAGASLFTRVKSLPFDILQALVKTPHDPYSLIRCAKGFVAISSSLCASSLNEELPISGSCLGAAAFDTELSRCFIVSEVEPMATCPIGYRIARVPLDYQYGPCRPIERIPPIPSCDPPFVFDPVVARCLYNSTHAGYLGCPPASVPVNEFACETAIQVFKNVTCPDDFEALLTKEGEAECRKTLKGRGNYSAFPRCPGNATEVIDYELYDEYNKPRVTCVSTQILRGSATCPESTVPYYTYLREERQPPVVTDATMGAPARTCVKVQEGQIRPSCYDMEKQVPFVLLIGQKDEEKKPINYNMLVPTALVETLIKPEWNKFTKDPQDDNEGNPLYRREEDIAVRVLCLSFHYAQPVLRCPEGYIRAGPNLQECRKKAFVDFVLTCPPGYYLNELSLVFGMYNMPRPKCIGKLPAATQYFCPAVKQPRLPTKKNEKVVYLKDIQRRKCIKAKVSRPLWRPSKETIDEIFPSLLRVEAEGLVPYVGIWKLSQENSEEMG